MLEWLVLFTSLYRLITGVTALRLRSQLGIGIIALFLIGTGCINPQSEPVQPPKSEAKVETKKENENQVNQQKQSKAMVSQENVYFSKQEKDDLKSIVKQPIIYKGSSHSKKVALTFDDGPDIQVTNQILDILKKENVPATFFVTGKMVKTHPNMLIKIYQEGHVIGNHTWSHPLLTKLSKKQLDYEFNQTDQLVEKLIGKKLLLVRPPYGETNTFVQEYLKQKGYLVINWSVDTNDWQGNSGSKIQQIVKQQVTNGGIVLQHNAGNELKGTVDALPYIIKYLKKQNYQLVTVDQLLDSPAYKEPQQP